MKYLNGFGNHFESEAIKNTLPIGQNSPQQVAHGLYAEQLSGSAFTAPKHYNQRSWLYRILPSITHREFQKFDHAAISAEYFKNSITPPTQMRWNPLPEPKTNMDFISSLQLFAFNGDVSLQKGAAVYLYFCNQSMQNCYFYSADGDWLIIPEMGKLLIQTEFGKIELMPTEIAVIPRGIKFAVTLIEPHARGYICENFGSHFMLPERGPIGSNGLANERDFQAPVACYEELYGDFRLLCKFQNNMWQAIIKHSPFDVVAWHGNYIPYKYDLKKFNTINTVSFDHTDPSIFTVLTSPSDTMGVANIDFVIFPERWMVAEHTFRPPYYHRNIMNELMGLILGVYDAKEEGFSPGGVSIHNTMSAHGPDARAFEQASHAKLKPAYYKDTLAFMFESRYVWQISEHALNAGFRQPDYLDCWLDLKPYFKSK